MQDIYLQKRLKELCNAGSTLLWLEGSKYERVLAMKLSGRKLCLQLSNETTRVVAYDQYVSTDVGLQFWNQGRLGVLYRWDQVPASANVTEVLPEAVVSFDDDPPPNMAA